MLPALAAQMSGQCVSRLTSSAFSYMEELQKAVRAGVRYNASSLRLIQGHGTKDNGEVK
jgi:hypothetical protein